MTGMSELWTEVLSRLSSEYGAHERGMRPVIALRVYHETMGAQETQRLIDKYSEACTICIANWERCELVKKFDKRPLSMSNGTSGRCCRRACSPHSIPPRSQASSPPTAFPV